MLRSLDLLRDADNHDLPPLGPKETTVCRSGAKNSAANAATSSAVSASTVFSTSSRLRYDSPYTAVLAKRYILAVGLSSDNISCPSVCCFASSSAAPRSPSVAMRANSALIAATAFCAVSFPNERVTPRTAGGTGGTGGGVCGATPSNQPCASTSLSSASCVMLPAAAMTQLPGKYARACSCLRSSADNALTVSVVPRIWNP